MTHYMRAGNQYKVAPPGALDITDHLPVGTYKVDCNPMSMEYFLVTVDDFEVTGKIYGDTIAHRDRIMRSFLDRATTTGVLLTGEKGSGKTLLAKMLSLKAHELDIPTLVINSAWCGDDFNAFMQSISQPVVVLFDEFEKVYDAGDQQQLLTLLDGTYTSKKLFVLTANDRFRVDEHMKNRPGRIYYGLEFGGVDADFVRAYCEDNLADKALINDVVATSRLFQRFNFDVLKALVEEMNRFDEGVDEALAMLNAKPEGGTRLKYDVQLFVDGEEIPTERMSGGEEWNGNPFVQRVHFWYVDAEKDEDGDETTSLVNVGPMDLVRVDADTGDYTYKSEDIVLVLSEQAPTTGYNRSLVY
jgi:hypothetical protein